MPALRLIEASTCFGPHPGFSTLRIHSPTTATSVKLLSEGGGTQVQGSAGAPGVPSAGGSPVGQRGPVGGSDRVAPGFFVRPQRQEAAFLCIRQQIVEGPKAVGALVEARMTA